MAQRLVQKLSEGNVEKYRRMEYIIATLKLYCARLHNINNVTLSQVVSKRGMPVTDYFYLTEEADETRHSMRVRTLDK